MKNVLVLGSGAREVAIVRSISQSLIENSIFCISKDLNPQINDLCKDYFVADFGVTNDVLVYSKEKEIDMAIIGPEIRLLMELSMRLSWLEFNVLGLKKRLQ